MWESDESEDKSGGAESDSTKGIGKSANSTGVPNLSDNSALAGALVLATQLGFSVACPMVVFIGGGAWLDNQLGWGPWLLFVGIILGLTSAGGLFFQIAKLPASRRPKTGSDVQGAPYKVEERRKLRMHDLGKPPTDKIDGNGH